MTKKLTVSALMIALSAVLSFITIFRMPNGGSVTAASMVPVLAVGMLYGTRHGLIAAFAYALLQLAINFYAPPAQTFLTFALDILLDYLLAFGVLGLGGVLYRAWGKKAFLIPISGGVCCILRLICHVLSGFLIWRDTLPQGQHPLLASLIYNGSYMGVEILITVAVLLLLAPFLHKQAQ